MRKSRLIFFLVGILTSVFLVTFTYIIPPETYAAQFFVIFLISLALGSISSGITNRKLLGFLVMFNAFCILLGKTLNQPLLFGVFIVSILLIIMRLFLAKKQPSSPQA